MKDYLEITRGISANLKALRADITDTMQGFSAMERVPRQMARLIKKPKS